MPIAQIAAQLDVAQSTVSRWTNPEVAEKNRHASRMRRASYPTGTCRDCGGPTRPDGCGHPHKLCRACAIKLRTIWSQEALIEAIRAFVALYGRVPGAIDWNPSDAANKGMYDRVQRFYDDGCWPYYNSVQRCFGSWNAAIKAAGFIPRSPGQRDAEVRVRVPK
jgi:hypothetical protein